MTIWLLSSLWFFFLCSTLWWSLISCQTLERSPQRLSWIQFLAFLMLFSMIMHAILWCFFLTLLAGFTLLILEACTIPYCDWLWHLFNLIPGIRVHTRFYDWFSASCLYSHIKFIFTTTFGYYLDFTTRIWSFKISIVQFLLFLIHFFKY